MFPKTLKAASTWIVVVSISLTLGVLAYIAQQDPQVYARLSLLAKGHLSVDLRAPDQSTTDRPRVPVSKLVYKRGTYLGYIDPYGHYVPKTDGGIDLQREGAMMASLYGIQFVCGAIALVGIFYAFLNYSNYEETCASNPETHRDL